MPIKRISSSRSKYGTNIVGNLTKNSFHAATNHKSSTSIQVCLLSLDCFPLFAPFYLRDQFAGRVGGAELQMYYLSKELARDKQFDVHVIVDDFGQDAYEQHEDVHLHKCAFRLNSTDSIYPLPDLNRRIRLFRCLYQITPDVCVHRSISLQTFILSMYARMTNTSFLYMMSHDGGAIPELDPDRSKTGWFLSRRLFEYGMIHADQIVVQNEKQKRALQENYERSSWIRPSAHPIQESKKTNKQCKYVSWIARGERRKQPQYFIDLAHQFPQTSFLMIMPDAGETAFRQQIKNDAVQTDNITFLNFVPHHRIDEYFSKTSIFVCTSTSEGFPNTFIEAARSSTPIVSYKINPDDILETHQMGICADGDQSKMEKGLQFLLNNESARQQMARNARSYAKQHHDIKKIIRNDKKIIRSLVNNKNQT